MNTQVNTAEITVDQLVLVRAKTLLFGALTFGLWQFGWIGQGMLTDKQGLLFGTMAIMTVVGAIGWVVTTVMLLKFNRQMKQLNSCSALHDELVVKNRNTAFCQSYFILFALIWLLIPAWDWLPFDGLFALRMIAAFGVVLPMVLFSVYELKNESEAPQ